MKPAMQMSPEGVQVIEHYETCVLRAYPDPKTGAAPWTCGWGATGHDIGSSTVWTQEQADARLRRDVLEREDMANAVIRVPVTQGQFDAFVDILFNVGPGTATKDGIVRLRNGKPSTLLRKLNLTDYAGAREQFALWISPGSNVEHGLRRRRRTDQALWDELSAREAIALGMAI